MLRSMKATNPKRTRLKKVKSDERNRGGDDMQKDESLREEKNNQETCVHGYPFERVLWRMDKTIKRLWVALLIVFVTLVCTNVAWLIYEAQFQEEIYTYEVQQDSGTGGTNTYTDNVVNLGGGYNGETNDKSDNQKANAKDGR